MGTRTKEGRDSESVSKVELELVVVAFAESSSSLRELLTTIPGVAVDLKTATLRGTVLLHLRRCLTG